VSLQAPDAECIKSGFGAEDGKVVLDCLCGDHAIEWVGMRAFESGRAEPSRKLIDERSFDRGDGALSVV
jgi:hypothetical protein